MLAQLDAGSVVARAEKRTLVTDPAAVDQPRRITTYQICIYSLLRKKAPEDGPVRSETCRANICDE